MASQSNLVRRQNQIRSRFLDVSEGRWILRGLMLRFGLLLLACPWPKLDLKAVDQTVARSALSAMALKNGSGPRIAAGRSVTAV